MATGIKICGIDTLELAELAVAQGVDAIGLVFAPGSARLLEQRLATEIALAVAGRTQRVGMFVDPKAAEVEQVLAAVPLDVLQFHGTESADFCRQFDLPFFKALPAGQRPAVAMAAEYPDAAGWLLDTATGGAFGGTGEAFDWSAWPDAAQRQETGAGPGAGRWILAGGLDVENVGAAIAALRPDMVDVSSGVEGAVKGCKDAAKIEAFVAAVHAADAQLSSQAPHFDPEVAR